VVQAHQHACSRGIRFAIKSEVSSNTLWYSGHTTIELSRQPPSNGATRAIMASSPSHMFHSTILFLRKGLSWGLAVSP
jgi:hypothetical protein